MKKYFYTDKAIKRLCLVAATLALMYELTMDVPEFFMYGDAIFRFVAQISSSIVASGIFYYFTVYCREVQKKKLFQKTINAKCTSIENTMNRIFNVLMGIEISNNTDWKYLNKETIEKRCMEIHVYDLCGIGGGVSGEYNYLEYFGNQCIYLSRIINEIFLKISEYMEAEELQILQEIADCQFVMTMINDYEQKNYINNFYYKNPILASRKKYFVEFYELKKKYNDVIAHRF